MFYAQFLLSKNAPLGLVWTAGHCPRRLKEDQVRQMDISGAVDTILDEEVRFVAHRMMAFLLLGVVRIFSRKVENLYDFSQQMLDMLLRLSTGWSKRSHAHSRSCDGIRKRPQKSISVPKRLEMDAFGIESSEDQESAIPNERHRPKHMLAESRRNRTRESSFKEKNLISGPDSEPFTPPKDVLSPERMMFPSVPNSSKRKKVSFASIDATAPESHTNDEQLLSAEYIANDSPSWINSMESYHYSDGGLLLGTDFDGDDRFEPMVLDEDEDLHLNLRSSYGNDFSTSPDDNMFYVENLTSAMEAPLHLIDISDVGKGEMQSEKFPSPKESPKVVTPSTKDHASTRQRHKMIWDSTIGVPNRVYKKWLDDTGNLKRQKKKARLFHTPSSIFEPMYQDLDSLEPKKSMPSDESSYCHEDALPSTDYVVNEQVSSSPAAPGTPAHKEMGSTSKNGTHKEEDLLTTITRMLFRRKKERVLKFSELVAGKTQTECARMLYAVLVLKTRGCIELQQEEAYGDILVTK